MVIPSKGLQPGVEGSAVPPGFASLMRKTADPLGSARGRLFDCVRPLRGLTPLRMTIWKSKVGYPTREGSL